MACDISMNEAPVVVDHQGYIPRNAIDHLNPFFFKSHQHAHSHAYHGHAHGQHSHPSQRSNHTSPSQTARQQPYTTAQPHQHSHSHPHNHSHSSLSPPSPDTRSYTSSSSHADLQTPVPRRMSVHVDHPTTLLSLSYSTPPATPPLTQLDKQTAVAIAANANAAAAAAAATNAPKNKDLLAWCTARARIPTPDGSEYFLHIYENKQDRKEHLAFVFGDAIRSQSLDAVQGPEETEMDRIKRGAYTGRLQNTVSPDQQQQQQDVTSITAVTSTSVAPTNTLTTTATTTQTTVIAVDTDQDAIMEDTTRTVAEITLVPKTDTTPSVGVVHSAPLVRIHSECFTGEIGHSARCDCGEQLDEAIRLMKAKGSGVVVYLRQEGRGIGLGEKLKAYNLQDLGYDTVMANLLLNHGADERTYEVAQAILEDLGLSQIRLLTNNPDKMEKIEKDSEIKVVERVPMMPKSWEAIQQGTEADFVVKEGAIENKIVRGKELDKYLKVKVERMRHLIPIPTSL